MSAGGTAFVYATLLEARPLLSRLDAKVHAVQPFTVYTGAGTHILISGVGLDAARRGARHLIENHAPGRIVNCGIAGSLCAGAGVGEVLQVAHATFDEPGAGLAQVRYRRIAGVALTEGGGIRADARLLSRAEPLFDAALRTRLATVADLVDMEGAAVAEICAGAGVDCALFKAVSDDASDRQALLDNLDVASECLAAFVFNQLASILHGSPRHELNRTRVY